MKNKNMAEGIRIEDLPAAMRDVARRIGLDACLELIRHYGGGPLYVAAPSGLERSLRDREICARFDGANHKALAREFGVTVARIYQIIDAREANQCKKQQK
ncbi:hypothetical protein DENIS_3478 [Desulfonema ishimotonii]|uniref:Mor transcription activator domain-containing protein n=1 Tax=Desulfonema ishimotonii TaxID=45657 RepID=A0A401FZY7_9BACT|nr:Mor transcription activator family protein [Desulfonema ishimotonii]GBC62506.1 hypothetical protein DENIS_3478 [Desulfonema ishimotonii]